MIIVIEAKFVHKCTLDDNKCTVTKKHVLKYIKNLIYLRKPQTQQVKVTHAEMPGIAERFRCNPKSGD